MELQTGTIVDRYAVEGLLGQGGMAIVYRVRHQQLGTLHALKVLMLPAQSIRDRLLQEGRVQARLRHPNIVNVTDLVEVDGAPGLVMEYIPGPSLDDLLRQCDLTVDQADFVARGVLDGVAAAHEVGLVHRDLKPGNILLEVKKDSLLPKITDFGLAKLVGDDAGSGSKTRSGLAMGTPCYMAPEQIRNAKGVDERADVFSLGAVLYELITGRRAFDGDDTFEIFSAVTAGQYTPIRSLVPEAPDRMVEAVARALATDREERVQTVEELARLWAGGTRCPEPAVAFAPAILQRAEELGSGVDDQPISWSPSSGGSTVPPPKVGVESHTLDLSLGEDEEVPPMPSLAEAIAPPLTPQPPRPRPQPQTSSNRDPRVRRTIILVSGIVTMAFAGLLGVGVLGSGALLLTRSPVAEDGVAAADTRQLAKEEAEVSDGGGGDALASAPAHEASGGPPETVAAAPPPPEVDADDAVADAEDAVEETGRREARAAPERQDAEPKGDSKEAEPEPEPEPEEALDEVASEAPPTVAGGEDAPTGRVEAKVALHPLAAGASAIGEVWLVGEGTKYHLPADVPAGTYAVEASFNNKPPVKTGTIVVKAGATRTLTCFASNKTCK